MQKEKGCGTCKKRLNNTQIFMTVLSFYILLTSIYGSVKLFNELISIFW